MLSNCCSSVACCIQKPHVKIVEDIFPMGQEVYDSAFEPNKTKLSRLTSYTLLYPAELSQICDLLGSKLTHAIKCQQHGSVIAGIGGFRDVMETCCEAGLVYMIRADIFNALLVIFNCETSIYIGEGAKLFIDYSFLCEMEDFSEFVAPVTQICRPSTWSTKDTETKKTMQIFGFAMLLRLIENLGMHAGRIEQHLPTILNVIYFELEGPLTHKDLITDSNQFDLVTTTTSGTFSPSDYAWRCLVVLSSCASPPTLIRVVMVALQQFKASDWRDRSSVIVDALRLVESVSSTCGIFQAPITRLVLLHAKSCTPSSIKVPWSPVATTHDGWKTLQHGVGVGNGNIPRETDMLIAFPPSPWQLLTLDLGLKPNFNFSDASQLSQTKPSAQSAEPASSRATASAMMSTLEIMRYMVRTADMFIHSIGPNNTIALDGGRGRGENGQVDEHWANNGSSREYVGKTPEGGGHVDVNDANGLGNAGMSVVDEVRVRERHRDRVPTDDSNAGPNAPPDPSLGPAPVPSPRRSPPSSLQDEMFHLLCILHFAVVAGSAAGWHWADMAVRPPSPTLPPNKRNFSNYRSYNMFVLNNSTTNSGSDSTNSIRGMSVVTSHSQQHQHQPQLSPSKFSSDSPLGSPDVSPKGSVPAPLLLPSSSDPPSHFLWDRFERAGGEGLTTPVRASLTQAANSRHDGGSSPSRGGYSLLSSSADAEKDRGPIGDEGDGSAPPGDTSGPRTRSVDKMFYKVVHPDGAVVTITLESSSQKVGHLPWGSVVEVAPHGPAVDNDNPRGVKGGGGSGEGKIGTRDSSRNRRVQLVGGLGWVTLTNADRSSVLEREAAELTACRLLVHQTRRCCMRLGKLGAAVGVPGASVADVVSGVLQFLSEAEKGVHANAEKMWPGLSSSSGCDLDSPVTTTKNGKSDRRGGQGLSQAVLATAAVKVAHIVGAVRMGLLDVAICFIKSHKAGRAHAAGVVTSQSPPPTAHATSSSVAAAVDGFASAALSSSSSASASLHRGVDGVEALGGPSGPLDMRWGDRDPCAPIDPAAVGHVCALTLCQDLDVLSLCTTLAIHLIHSDEITSLVDATAAPSARSGLPSEASSLTAGASGGASDVEAEPARPSSRINRSPSASALSAVQAWFGWATGDTKETKESSGATNNNEETETHASLLPPPPAEPLHGSSSAGDGDGLPPLPPLPPKPKRSLSFDLSTKGSEASSALWPPSSSSSLHVDPSLNPPQGADWDARVARGRSGSTTGSGSGVGVGGGGGGGGLKQRRRNRWLPLTFSGVQLLQDAVFNLLCNAFAHPVEHTLAAWRIQKHLFEKFGSDAVIHSIPMLLALEDFWRVFPLAEMTAPEVAASTAEALDSQKLFFAATLLTIARRVASLPLERLTLSLVASWRKAGLVPSGLLLEPSTAALSAAHSHAPSHYHLQPSQGLQEGGDGSVGTMAGSSPSSVASAALDRRRAAVVVEVNKNELMAALLHSSQLRSDANKIRQVFEVTYSPQEDPMRRLEEMEIDGIISLFVDDGSVVSDGSSAPSSSSLSRHKRSSSISITRMRSRSSSSNFSTSGVSVSNRSNKSNRSNSNTRGSSLSSSGRRPSTGSLASATPSVSGGSDYAIGEGLASSSHAGADRGDDGSSRGAGAGVGGRSRRRRSGSGIRRNTSSTNVNQPPSNSSGSGGGGNSNSSSNGNGNGNNVSLGIGVGGAGGGAGALRPGLRRPSLNQRAPSTATATHSRRSKLSTASDTMGRELGPLGVVSEARPVLPELSAAWLEAFANAQESLSHPSRTASSAMGHMPPLPSGAEIRRAGGGTGVWTEGDGDGASDERKRVDGDEGVAGGSRSPQGMLRGAPRAGRDRGRLESLGGGDSDSELLLGRGEKSSSGGGEMDSRSKGMRRFRPHASSLEGLLQTIDSINIPSKERR